MNEIKKPGKIKQLFFILLFTVLYFIRGVFFIIFSPADFVFFLSVAIIYLLEIAVTKKAGMNPLVLMLSAPLALIAGTVLLLAFPDTGSEDLAGVLLVSSVIRVGLSVIDFIRLKKYKLIPLSLAVAVALYFSIPLYMNFYRRYINSLRGEADKTSSWHSINQSIQRNESWQEFVTDTPFKLGELSSEVTDDYPSGDYHCDLGSYPSLDGSTVCVPMAVEFARQHLNMDDENAEFFTSFSTTHYAYEELIDNNLFYVHDTYLTAGNTPMAIRMSAANLILATEPSEEELAYAESKGVTLIKKPICYDGFVFITHKDNPVDSLTVEQIKDIYSGKIRNWKDVGGKNEKIRAFQREENSGSQTAMENLVMGGRRMIDPIEVKVIVGMGELVDAVAEYQNETASIGYTYRYYIDTLYKNDNIKTIAVNGIAPTDENIRNRTYPFSTNYYGVIRKGEENETGGKFLDWILSEEGQKCVAQAGYITME